jgi:tetratricopeptide (TPR) repeat protein
MGDFDNVDQEIQGRMQTELEQAPEEMLGAFQHLMDGDLERAMASFLAAIPALEKIDKVWAGAAYCCYAYCLKETEQYGDAIRAAEDGKKRGLNLTGKWYYYEALTDALNLIDRLGEAAAVTEEAISFYRSQDALTHVAGYLDRKANVFKQMASRLSRDAARTEEARKHIIEAFHAICESLSLTDTDVESMDDELSAMATIAKRVGVTRDDLPFLDTMEDVADIIDPYFEDQALARQTAVQYYHKAIEERQKGNRQFAHMHFDAAIRAFPDREPEDLAMKALVMYQCGVNLLIMHGLNRQGGSRPLSGDKNKVAENIRKLWQEVIDIYSRLDPEFVAEFDSRCPPGLKYAVSRIKADPLMRGL